MSPGPAAALLAALGAAALLSHRWWAPAAICIVLLAVCSRAPWRLGQSYAHDVVTLRHGKIDDGSMRFARAVTPSVR